MTTAAGRVVLTFDIDDAGLVKGLGGVEKKIKSSTDQWRDFGRELTDVGGSLTKFVTLPLVGLAGAATKSAMDFESSFAGIVKTVDDATDSMGRLTPVGKQLQQGMRDLAKEIPINVNSLNAIGESAGQLGIKSQNIVKFTDVVAKMGVTTLLSTEEAASGMARLANITSMPQEHFDRLGSTIVALGNNFATTEPEILEFGLRIAGAGTSAGMAEHQILSIGTAVASVGVQAEAGGTAVQKVILDMLQATVQGGEQLETFARTAGMTAEQFRVAFEEDAAGAFSAFVTGLGKEGKHAISVLDELGLADARLIRTFLALSNASGLLTDALGLGAEAWEQNTALSREAELRFATTESRLTLLGNRVRDVGITFGNALLPAMTSVIKGLTSAMPVLEGMANAFAAAPAPIQMTAIGLAAVAAGIGPVLWGTGQLITSTATVASAFGAKAAAASLLNGNLITLSGSLRVMLGLLGSVGAVVGAISLRGWIEQFAETKMGVNSLNTELDALGRDASWWEKLKVIIPRLNDGMMGASVAGTLAARAIRGVGAAAEDIALPLEGGAQQVAQQQQYLTASVEGLSAAVDLMKQRGASSADVLKEWGADAANAAATAKRLGMDTAALPPVVLDLARAYDAQGTASQRAARAAEAKAAADKLAKEASEAAEEAAKRQRDALKSLGLITSGDVVEAITSYNEGLNVAATQGSRAFVAGAVAVIARLKELRAEAVKSGLSTDAIDREMQALSATLRAVPIPALTTSISRVTPAMDAWGRSANVVTTEMLAQSTAAHLAQRDTDTLAKAYETLGITSQASLASTAAAARQAYEVIRNDASATYEQVESARQRVLNAEIAAGERTVSIWQSQIWPAIQSVVAQTSESIAQSFSDMLTGASSFSEGFLAIWEAIKGGVRGILDSILKTFINNFLQGMLEGISGWAKQAGGIIGQVMGLFGSAKASIPGLLSPSVLTAPGAAGGAGAGAGGVGLGAGLATAGLGALAVGAGAVLGKMAWEWGTSFFSDTLPELAVSESEARNAAERYFGPDYEQYTQGIDWDNVLPGQIPGLASGGVVDPTPGGTLARLAEAGRPELVAPLPPGFDLAETLSSLKSAVRGSMRAGVIDNHISVDGRLLARIMTEYQVDEWRLAGVTT